MKINKQDGPPKDLLYFDDELDIKPSHVEDVVEIFKTPLTGAYNWDYIKSKKQLFIVINSGKLVFDEYF